MRAKEFDRSLDKDDEDNDSVITIDDRYELRRIPDWTDKTNRQNISTIFSSYYQLPARELWNEIVKYPPRDPNILIYGLYDRDTMIGFSVFRRTSLDITYNADAHPEVKDWTGKGIQILATAVIAQSGRKKLIRAFTSIPQKMDYDYIWADYYDNLPTVAEFIDATEMVPLFSENGILTSYTVFAKSFSNPLLNIRYREMADKEREESEKQNKKPEFPEPKKDKSTKSPEPAKSLEPLKPIKPLDTIKPHGAEQDKHHHKKHDKKKPRFNHKVLTDYVNESIQCIPYLDDADIADRDPILEAMIDKLLLDQAGKNIVAESDITPSSYYHGDTRNPFWGLYINGKLKFRYSVRSEALEMADQYSEKFPQDRVEVKHVKPVREGK